MDYQESRIGSAIAVLDGAPWLAALLNRAAGARTARGITDLDECQPLTEINAASVLTQSDFRHSGAWRLRSTADINRMSCEEIAEAVATALNDGLFFFWSKKPTDESGLGIMEVIMPLISEHHKMVAIGTFMTYSRTCFNGRCPDGHEPWNSLAI